MNLKACTFERLAFISLGFGRGAHVGKTSLLEVEFILRRKRRRWAYSFFFIWYASGPGIQPKPSIFGRRRCIFLTMRSEDSETTQQRLRPRRFDSTVKRVPKLRFEPVSFLFLVCLYNKQSRTLPKRKGKLPSL